MYFVKKKMLFFCGVTSLGSGIVGIFMPLWPTTPFLILAAACFARSSQKAYDQLLANKWCGEYIRNYREGKGISLKHKIITLSLLYLVIGYSLFFVAEIFWQRFILIAVVLGVTAHVAGMATCRKKGWQ